MIRYKTILNTTILPTTRRNLSSYTRFQEWYRALWAPKKPDPPPYKHICQVGDPTLRLQATEVDLKEINSEDIKNVLLMLRSVMKHYKSVGISAPQIGIPLRIIMIEIPDFVVEHFGPEVCKAREMVPTPLKVFINPIMEVKDYKKNIFPEACESIKGISAWVPRFRGVRVKGFEYDGSPTEWETTGWAARIVQHEMDHLDGKIFTDIMNCKTLQVDYWQTINARRGNFRLPYKPMKP